MLSGNALCAAWFMWLLTAGTIDEARQHRTVEMSKAVSIGMTVEQVREILGDPAAEYEERRLLARLLLGDRPKQWMYGTELNLEYLFVRDLPFLNPFPINVRIAEYAEKDLVIDWSKGDTVDAVDAVRRPEFDVPKDAYDLLEAADFVDLLFQSVIFSKR
jgi:hypothetical protein